MKMFKILTDYRLKYPVNIINYKILSHFMSDPDGIR